LAGLSPGSGKSADFVVAHAVSCEPVSADFPVKQGKRREYWRFQTHSPCHGAAKLLKNSYFSFNFPAQEIREFLSTIRDFQGHIRDLYCRSGYRFMGLSQAQIGG
jgi:hypothetical protein